MKKATPSLLLLVALAGCAHSPVTITYLDGPTRPVIDFEFRSRRPRMGPPPPGYWKIVGEPVPGWSPRDMLAPPPTDGPGVWTSLGPRPITGEYWSGNANAGGRVVSIAPHPTDPNIVYLASASGGVWKSTNAGAAWTPITDELSVLNHGALAIDPSNPNTIYAGTGEYTTQSAGDGLFRSTDAGATWTRIGTTSQVGSRISKVIVHPTNSQIIHVTGGSGYHRSTNGGSSWSTILSGACSDLALDPVNPQNVFIARHGDGIYRSTTGGPSPTKLTSGLPTSGVNRIVLAISKSNPQVLHACFVAGNNGLLGHYKTTDGGTSWTPMTNTPNYPSPQGWYDVFLGIDPANENIVYAGGVFPSYAPAGVIKTTNGGDSWTDITVIAGTQVHPDQQCIAFGPGNVLWVGNDGGVWKSTNAGGSWINCNATLNAVQIYNVALHPTDPNQLVGGTQDNGTITRTTASDAWPQILSGDGGFCAYDRNDPLRRYLTYVYLAVYRYRPGSNTSNISGSWSNDPRNFIAPLIADPNNARTLLGGTNRVWRNTAADTTSTWTAISTNEVGNGGTLNAIAVAQGFPNTIYTGSSNGAVYVTTDASQWNNRSTGLPSGGISDIMISPTDPNTAYVSSSTSSGNRILRTTNAGVSWSSVTGTLPSGVRVTALEVDWRFNPPHLWVGSGAGVYHSTNHGATWVKDGADLPNVNIGDLAIDRTNNTLTAGTYGRGVWRTILPTPPLACYANCDESTGAPLLTANDFQCFLNRFAAGDPYANCDGSTGTPTLTANDFQCFLNKFATGCT
jgi:photosystem II stability/assembly factor-like uncharacterized protein